MAAMSVLYDVFRRQLTTSSSKSHSTNWVTLWCEAHSYCVSGHHRGRSLPHSWKAGGTGHSRYSKGSVSLSMILSDARLTQTAPWNGGFSPPPECHRMASSLARQKDSVQASMQSRAFPPSGDPCRNRLFPPYYPAWLRSDRRRHEPGCAVKYEKGRAALTHH